MQAKRTRASASSAPQISRPDDDDEIPENADEFRLKLARRISRYVSDAKHRWCTCREPSCKRRRQCVAPHGRCSNAVTLRPQTAEQAARNKGRIQRLLRIHLERLDAARTAQKTDKSHQKS